MRLFANFSSNSFVANGFRSGARKRAVHRPVPTCCHQLGCGPPSSRAVRAEKMAPPLPQEPWLEMARTLACQSWRRHSPARYRCHPTHQLKRYGAASQFRGKVGRSGDLKGQLRQLGALRTHFLRPPDNLTSRPARQCTRNRARFGAPIPCTFIGNGRNSLPAAFPAWHRCRRKVSGSPQSPNTARISGTWRPGQLNVRQIEHVWVYRFGVHSSHPP
jgi:hypothetical protein